MTRGALTAYPILRPTLSTRVAIVTLRDQHPVTLTQHASAMLHDVCRAPVRQKIRAGAVLIGCGGMTGGLGRHNALQRHAEIVWPEGTHAIAVAAR